MNDFTLGVVSSLVASAIAVVGGWLVTRQGRRWLTRQLSTLTGIGIERTYDHQTLAAADLATDLAQARWIKVMAGRGNELTREAFRLVWLDATGRLEFVEVLLPDPRPAGSWLDQREREVCRIDPAFRGGVLRDQVCNNIRYVRQIAQRHDRIRLKLYDLPQVARVIVTDRVAYLTPYAAHLHGRRSPCLVFRNPSPLYDHALRLFSTAWECADEPFAGLLTHLRTAPGR
ncbi:hypothetical protein [Catellatospora chokoriensis]|uniref:Uncharacterized protein n=1 Tax=Catellatospora chokoriensis TaxID=310353 RepID=A0A8J3JUY5_9ACTN|nr:hypothetical protein [Catellatospora chokoriensis]GIF91521.1 hypothetical protein Cch02nite_49650 [Catellatospora chokoriensis]